MDDSAGYLDELIDRAELTIEEWKRLGFVRIAGTGFVFRDQLKRNPYRDEKSACNRSHPM